MELCCRLADFRSNFEQAWLNRNRVVQALRASGACCLPNGRCAAFPEARCDKKKGEHQGDDTNCDMPDIDCPTVGACCLPGTGECIVSKKSECGMQGGRFKLGKSCEDVSCPKAPTPPPTPPKGACCIVRNGRCRDNVPLSRCNRSGREWGGEGSSCSDEGFCPTPTPSPTCCFEDGDCDVVEEGECTGEFQGVGQTCDDVSCPVPCELSVDKFCSVPRPPTSDFDCDKPIESLSMRWDGEEEPISIIAYAGDTDEDVLAEIGDISVGDVVTVTGYSDAPKDVFWEVFDSAGSKLGESMFHLSCSDDDMNGPEDCFKNQGNGKKDDDDFINDWLLEGMQDSQSTFFCTSQDPQETSECEAFIGGGGCEGKVTALYFRYEGGGCDQTTNTQEGKVECDDDVVSDGGPVSVEAVSDKTDISPSTETINIGDEFVVTGDDKLKSDTEFEITQNGSPLQELNIHTSCSKPLSVGDSFGSVLLVGLDQEKGPDLRISANVDYTYVIRNTGSVPAVDISVVDDQVGEIDEIDTLDVGEEVVLTATDSIDVDTVNVVTASGKSQRGGKQCRDSSSAAVKVTPAPPRRSKGKGKGGSKSKDKSKSSGSS